MVAQKKPNRRELSKKDKENLYNDYIGLIIAIVLKHISQCRILEFGDLIDEGYFGLLRAAELFDENKKTKFTTYATWHIKNSIRGAIKNQDKVIRISAHIIYKMSRYIKSVEKLSIKLGCKPSIKEIAKEMDTSEYYVKRVKRLLEQPPQLLSLDAPVGKDTSLKNIITIEKNEILSEDLTSKQDLDIFLREHLTQREEKVIRLRFGLDDDNPLELKEIGEIINKTKQMVSVITKKALEKLRKALKI
ncbi:sigma-70 family RNA polymerase sigma factor [Patescibacteria group bacterium]|nr:sigma-70 family RNA polymerase sigma factor [Patescibacteria group bacterium]